MNEPIYVELNGVMVLYDQVPMIYEKVLEFYRQHKDNNDIKTIELPYMTRGGIVPIVFTVDELEGREDHEEDSD